MKTMQLTKTSMFILSFLGASMASIGRAQDPESALGRKLAEACHQHNVPALTAAVVNAEGVVQAECYGIRKRGGTEQITLSDRFSIGSCTKAMTATLAAVMVDAGKIDWDTSIEQVWPRATQKDVHASLRKVTLEQLLSHQSGLAADVSDISGPAWAEFFDEKESPQRERRRLLKLVLAKPPSGRQSQFAYSNLGYAVVAAMLETRAGEPFESLMKKHLFEPLDMRSAEFRSLQWLKQNSSPLVWGHQTKNGQPIDPNAKGSENPTVYAACGTVQLTIEDFAKFAQWHLAGRPQPVLQTQAAFDQLHRPQVDYTLPGTKYASGWICLKTGLGPGLQHAGSNTNFFALIWVLPEADFAAVVCTNTGEAQAFPACDAMIGYLMSQFAVPKQK